jgi:acyl dehydratase
LIDPDRLLKLVMAPRRCTYSERDTMLYALGIGFGSDPMDGGELRFVYEDGLKAMPTQATTVAWDRSWVPATGIDWPKVVHGEERIVMGRALPPAGEVIASSRIAEVLDKGTGALVRMETRLHDAVSEDWLCTTTTGFFVRGEGGFSQPPARGEPRKPLPERAPDLVRDVQTSGNQALLYRLSGDRNPHHALPVAARAGGFERPLLHGLCTYGMACRSILRSFCDFDPACLAAFDARFAAPVYPGDALRFEMWQNNNEVLLRGRCLERENTVIEAIALLRDVRARA